jgi:H+-transporting ATPase
MEKFLKKYAISDSAAEGMTTEKAEAYQAQHGYNEIIAPEVSKFWIFVGMFRGTMPYMLETALVVAAVVGDTPDAIIIAVMLTANGLLGFKEEMECLEALAKLTQTMESKVTCVRDGVGLSIPTRLLVPGDIIMLINGLLVPADCNWFKGDQLAIDTAALTGEGIPRKYPSDDYGEKIQSGATVVAGEAYGIVTATGTDTEIGGMTAEIQKDKAKGKQLSVFEDRVMLSVKIIIVVSVIICIFIFVQQGIANHEFTAVLYKKNLLTVLSVIIAAIPIALPIVLNVTMSLGAGKMASHFKAIVTSIPALQDIASMSVLCSDKTGTLTTAKMTIIHDKIWCNTNFTPKDVGFYAMLASSRDKKEDAVDRTVVKYFDKEFGPGGQDLVSEYTKTGGMGFNAVYKRVVVDLVHPKIGKIRVAKGLASKVVDTEDGSVDDADEQWKVDDYKNVMEQVKTTDKGLAQAGYKTLGVAIKINDNPWVFCGILPMMDPPRGDSKQTVERLRVAGIKTKMITGDHLNIAIETARQVAIGPRIFAGSEVRAGTQTSKQNIYDADGFAQVLPSDKREVVEVLKNHHGLVVGMTGDGVNDAPALSAAQCGVAVDDATDAAKNAAAIQLRAPGLSAIYFAVVESRRIFRKLKSYVTYRFAASIQIVVCLSILILASNCAINPTYIIMLALFNDLTMLPIAYDAQCASLNPDNPDVRKILFMSAAFGLMETMFTLFFAYAIGPSNMTKAFLSIPVGNVPGIGQTGCFSPAVNPDDANPASKAIQSAIWLQMFVAAEILIFSARSPTYFSLYQLPAGSLFASVMIGCILASVLANVTPYFGGLPGQDIFLIWVYDLVVLVIIDCIKVKLLQFLNEETEVLPDEVFRLPTEDEEEDEELAQANAMVHPDDKMTTRESAAAVRMTKSQPGGVERLSQVGGQRPSQVLRSSIAGRGSVSSRAQGSQDLRYSSVGTKGSLRPVTPANARAGY